METLTGIRDYKTSELKNSLDLDAYAVRDEAERRQSLLRREYERLERRISVIDREMIECGLAIENAWKEIHKS